MGHRRDDDELVLTRPSAYAVAAKQGEFQQCLGNPEVVPGIDEQGRHVDFRVIAQVSELVPPRVGERARHHVHPVVGRGAGALHHVDQRQTVADGGIIERGQLRRRVEIVGEFAPDLGRHIGGRAIEQLVAVDRHPADRHRQFHRAAVARPEIAVAPAGRAHRAARALGDHRPMVGIAGLGQINLRVAEVGAAIAADLAVRPRLAGQPVDRIVAVLQLVPGHDVQAAGFELAALVLNRHHIAETGEAKSLRVGAAKALLVIRRANQDRRQGFGRALWHIEIGRELDPVRHRDQHAFLDPYRVLASLCRARHGSDDQDRQGDNDGVKTGVDHGSMSIRTRARRAVWSVARRRRPATRQKIAPSASQPSSTAHSSGTGIFACAQA